MGTVRRIEEQSLVDELLAQFTEELRTSGTTNFALLDRCPVRHQRKLRSLMNAAALMNWAANRAARPARERRPVSVDKQSAHR